MTGSDNRLFEEPFFQDVAAELKMTPNALWTALVQSIFPQTIKVDGRHVPYAPSAGDIILFLHIARRYSLDPLVGEIFPIPRKGGHGVKAAAYLDGYLTIMNRHRMHESLEVEFGEDEQRGIYCTVTIERKDRSRPIVVTEWMSECKCNTDPWNKSPRRQLRHKAITQCARVAYGLSGIVDGTEEDDHEEARAATAPTTDVATVDVATFAASDQTEHEDAHAHPSEPAEEPAEGEPALIAERSEESATLEELLQEDNAFAGLQEEFEEMRTRDR